MDTQEKQYAVIFTSTLSDDTDGYDAHSQLLIELAEEQEGFLGIESARSGIGITVSYWSSLEAIKQWKKQSEHIIAQKLGKSQWYDSYSVKVCEVLRSYSFNKK